jgi:hypothetical protein
MSRRASALARGRAAAEAAMGDTCMIRRSAGSTDPVTGYPTRTYTALYSGPCRVQQHQATADRQDVGEDTLLLLRLEVQLPVVGSEGLQVGDEVTVTAAANDTDLVGRTFLIHDLAHKTRGDLAACAVHGEDRFLMPSQSLRFSTDELAEVADILAQAPGVAASAARGVVAKGALNIKNDARRRASGIAHAPTYPYTITYDTHEVVGGVWAEIGPDKQKKVGGGPHKTPGNLGGVLEFGGPRSAPIPHLRPAAEAERPRFEKALEDLAVKAIGL